MDREAAYAKYFIGQSYLAPLVSGKEVNVSNVTFEAGCRNNWHIHHKACQILIAVGGRGYYQEWGKEPVELNPGDVVYVAAGDQALAWGRAGFRLRAYRHHERGGRRLERVAGAGRGRIRRVALNRRTVARARQNTTADTMVSESSENSVLTSTKPTA